MIYLMRHGESFVNISQTLSCRYVDEPLTPAGLRQVEQAAAWLIDRSIRQIIASPLLRAQQTAELIAGQLGVDFTTVEGLREIDCGQLEGRNDPEAWQAFQQVLLTWIGGNLDAGFVGGETGHQARQRFALFMNELPPCDGDTLVVGHGGIFSFGVLWLCSGFDPAAPRDFYLPNTSFTLIDRTPAGLVCVQWGVCDHLTEPTHADVPSELLE